jgi:branched-chain amino acid transport system substrate-binding protein
MNPQKNKSIRTAFAYWLLTGVGAVALISMLSASRAHARDIVVGQSLDLSGQTNIGKDFSNGIRTYFDAINAKGGVRGRKLQLIQLDDAGQASDAANNIAKLARDTDVDVLIGPTNAQTFLAAASAAVFRRSSLSLLGAPTGARSDATDSNRVVSIRASYRDEARLLLAHITQTLGAKKIALVQGEGGDSDSSANAFREEAIARSVKLVFDGSDKAWRARTTQNRDIDAVVVAGDAIGVSDPIAHARSTAGGANLFGFSTIDHRTLQDLGKTSAVGMMISQAMPAPEKTIHPFQREHRQLMKQYRDEPPSVHTLEGYVVARLLVNALETIDGEPTPQRVTAALRNMRDLEFGPMNVSTRIPSNAVRFVNLSAVSKRGALIE